MSEDGPRVVHAGLALLDRQLLDRDGFACGKVDDLELDEREDGTVLVTAILCGPGALLERVGRARLGGWLRRFAASMYPWSAEAPGRVPFERVSRLSNHVELDVHHEELATFAGERWVRDHLVGRIPGSGHRAGG
jgi:hypothetical protein